MSRSTARTGRRRIAVWLLVANLVLLLFPPVTWLLPHGSAVAGIGYFVVTGLVAVGSLVALTRLSAETAR